MMSDKVECPYCENTFVGTYDSREAWLIEHIEYDHAPEDAPSADNGYAPPRSKHVQIKTARKIN